ncbi:hypothetical protein SPHV1_280044 [Novosphingobium sp. KN65.2]|nr:hypothetical protein SPHV1_280044 [Novosphingobium sp. KN65.2]
MGVRFQSTAVNRVTQSGRHDLTMSVSAVGRESRLTNYLKINVLTLEGCKVAHRGIAAATTRELENGRFNTSQADASGGRRRHLQGCIGNGAREQ